ncbi:nucleoside diphosphate kinase Ndk1 [Lecanora helva]
MENSTASPPSDPPIYKHLNAKTQGLLRQSNRVQQEQKQAAEMSNEQTYKLAAMKLVTPSKEHLEKHYEDLSDKPFYKGLVTYMLSGPICAMVWEGREAVKTGRTLLGATNPLQSAPGTIRGDFAIDVGRNVCHGSDAVESAKKEIDLWFSKGEVISYKQSQHDWIYEK